MRLEEPRPESHRLKSLCVYCGSSAGAQPAYARAAEEMGGALGEKGITLIYGGGKVGLMGALANAALEAGGEVVGVIPQGLVDREVAHEGLDRLLITTSMHERKARMADLADAFVALPGGLGTLEELFETWTWGQLGIHEKPLGLLDVDGYFEPLITFLNHAVKEGFVRKPHRGMLVRAAEPDALLDRLSAWEPPRVEKWLSRKES